MAELMVLATNFNFAEALKPTVQKELKGAEDSAGDCEGADISPPPSPLLSPFPSPLTTPSSSAGNSPTWGPSLDTNESIPALALTGPPSSTQNSDVLIQPSGPDQPTHYPALTHIHVSPPILQLEPTSTQPARQLPSTLTPHQRAGKRARQAKKRAQQLDPLAGKVRSSLSKKWMQPHAIHVNWSAKLLPAAKGAFVGVRYHPHNQSKPWTLQELQEQGFRVIKWDGW
jgi:hypothetical protein